MFLAVPMHWRYGAAAKMRAIGAELELVQFVHPEVDIASSDGSYVRGNSSGPLITAAVLAEATENGHWPQRRTEGARPHTSSGQIRSSAKEPPVLDRIFSGPFALGTTDKYKKTVKNELQKELGHHNINKWTKSPPKGGTAELGGKRSSSAGASSPELHYLARTVFARKPQKVANGPVQKLTHAEKLHLMIMQVKDMIGEDNLETHDNF